ncbi:MAG: hypothetical protein AMXMBFR45_24410 [Gammaproteobacteria bacterium]
MMGCFLLLGAGFSRNWGGWLTPEQFKAWSQNLGHEGVLTTLYAYGAVAEGRQREIIRGFGMPG